MLRTVLIFAIIGIYSCQSGPAIRPEDAQKVQCSVCQFLGASMAAKTGATREASVAHCLKFEGCEKQLTDCEIISTVHAEIQRTPEKFQNSLQSVSSAAQRCSSEPSALVISESASNVQCMLCFLVYDVLKYINYSNLQPQYQTHFLIPDILENPMLGTVKAAIAEACAFLNEEMCQALFEPDTFGAIIRGLQNSLGGFYDLIAVQGFGCVPYTQLFGECPGH
ncbi:hypothetical protein L3Y34_005791 [Caenorhabditis briggsae]|uniref:Saposin B-type domain-containing protein n=1 Tax=Caenorhabditis briggsae TaxID=6238 RepID=A0AAE9D7Z3_CAEBR|nr:hypothetical protein L3Y34_005791 [Caenorhabditis briggsae]